MSRERRPALRAITTPLEEVPPIRRAEGSFGPRACLHEVLLVDAGKRVVFCERCKHEFDPYEALFMLASEIERYEWSVRSNKDAAHRYLTMEREAKREERNAKARLRLARKRCIPIDARAISEAAKQAALEVAAIAPRFHGWEEMDEAERERIRWYVRKIVETYAGVLHDKSVIIEGDDDDESSTGRDDEAGA